MIGMESEIKECGWCEEPILPNEPKALVDGEYMHLHCAAEEQDHANADWLLGRD